MVEEKLKQAIANLSLSMPTPEPTPTTSTPVAQPRPLPPVKEKEIINWELKSNEELWATKAQGSAAEKIRRSFEAICLYNSTVATGDTDRLAVTNLALRELSGVNGLVVGDWIKSHADEIISFHNKYEMQNSKDPSRV